MKKLLSLALSLLLACSLCTALAADYSDVFTNFDLRDSWTAATEITFTDTAVTINGSGAAADGTVVTITAPAYTSCKAPVPTARCWWRSTRPRRPSWCWPA